MAIRVVKTARTHRTPITKKTTSTKRVASRRINSGTTRRATRRV